jgi:hypothetical protein
MPRKDTRARQPRQFRAPVELHPVRSGEIGNTLSGEIGYT